MSLQEDFKWKQIKQHNTLACKIILQKGKNSSDTFLKVANMPFNALFWNIETEICTIAKISPSKYHLYFSKIYEIQGGNM